MPLNGLLLARALHVLGVVVWICGVYIATCLFLPALRRGSPAPERLVAFQTAENRITWQAPPPASTVSASGPCAFRKSNA